MMESKLQLKVEQSFMSCFVTNVTLAQLLLTESKILLESKEPNTSKNLESWWTHQKKMIRTKLNFLRDYKHIEESKLRKELINNGEIQLSELDKLFHDKHQQLKSAETFNK